MTMKEENCGSGQRGLAGLGRAFRAMQRVSCLAGAKGRSRTGRDLSKAMPGYLMW